jgi:hypothetical protein
MSVLSPSIQLEGPDASMRPDPPGQSRGQRLACSPAGQRPTPVSVAPPIGSSAGPSPATINKKGVRKSDPLILVERQLCGDDIGLVTVADGSSPEIQMCD